MDPLGLARGLHVAAMLSLFGALLHGVVLGRALPRLVLGSLLAALATGAVWLLLQAGSMAGDDAPAAILAAAPAVLFETRFGTALLLRLALLLLAGALAGLGRPALALPAAAVALAAQSWMGHPAASGDASLLVASVLHILAAGAWLGGLWPLFLAIGAAPGPAAARAARRFFWVGLPAVLVLAATAFWQGVRLIGGVAGLICTDYGRLALFKLAGLLLLLALAAINRMRLTPALATDARAVRRLRRSIVVASLIGLAVVLAAGQLAGLSPATYAAPP
jgi:putative copper export protein